MMLKSVYEYASTEEIGYSIDDPRIKVKEFFFFADIVELS